MMMIPHDIENQNLLEILLNDKQQTEENQGPVSI